MSARRRDAVLLTLATTFVLSGCTAPPKDYDKPIVLPPRAKKSAPKPQATPKPVVPVKMATTELPWLPTIEGEGAALLAARTPREGNDKGKGLIVFAPVVRSAGVDPNFADGCSRWLFLNSGHDLALAQTPSWYLLGILPGQLRRADLRLGPEEARRATAWVGTTHYAVGAAEPGKISFQVHGPDGKPVGAPIELTGDESAMLAALPAAANQLRNRMGLAEARIAPPQETAADMKLLGRLRATPSADIAEKDVAALRQVCPRSAVANLIYFNVMPNAEPDPEDRAAVARRLLQLAPGNLIALAEVARDRVLPDLKTQLDPIAASDANNYLLLFSRMNVPDNDHPPIGLSLRLIDTAPRNSEAWLWQASSQGITSAVKRQGRTVGQISDKQWETLNQLYAHYRATATKALSLNPRSIRAAIEVGWAAIASGDQETAYHAIELCFQLLEHQHGADRVADLALEAYHPKWGGSPELLQKAATRLVALRVASLEDATAVAESLAEHRFQKEAQQRARAIVQTTEARLKADPNDFRAHYARREALGILGRGAEKVAAARRCAALRPRDVAERLTLIDTLKALKRPDEAIAEAQRFARDLPQEAQAHFALCEALFVREKYRDAVEPARQAVALKPQNHRMVAALGYALQHSGQPAEAAQQYEKALGISQNDADYMLLLGESLCMAKRVSEGRQWIERVRDLANDERLARSAEALLKQYPAP